MLPLASAGELPVTIARICCGVRAKVMLLLSMAGLGGAGLDCCACCGESRAKEVDVVEFVLRDLVRVLSDGLGHERNFDGVGGYGRGGTLRNDTAG